MMDPHELLPSESQKVKGFRDTRCPAVDFPADARRKLEVILHSECMIPRPCGLIEAGTVSTMLYHQCKQNNPSSVGFTFLSKVADQVQNTSLSANLA
jgi:hypothetical protein